MATDTVGVGRAFALSSLVTKKNIRNAQQWIALAMMIAGALSNVETLTAQTAIVAVGGALYMWTKKYLGQLDEDELAETGFSYPPGVFPAVVPLTPTDEPTAAPELGDVLQ